MSEQLTLTPSTDPWADRASAPVTGAPATAFGLRAAALAGIFVSADAVATGLCGVFDNALGAAYTTAG
jgi:hypothetical protein